MFSIRQYYCAYILCRILPIILQLPVSVKVVYAELPGFEVPTNAVGYLQATVFRLGARMLSTGRIHYDHTTGKRGPRDHSVKDRPGVPTSSVELTGFESAAPRQTPGLSILPGRCGFNRLLRRTPRLIYREMREEDGSSVITRALRAQVCCNTLLLLTLLHLS